MNKLQWSLLKDIAVSQTGPFGSQLHEHDYVSIGTPIVTVEHLGEISFSLDNLPLVSDQDKARLIKYTLKEGDIVFSRVGSIDRCTYVTKKEDGWMFSGRCLRVRFNDKANAIYVSFYFRQKYFKEMMLNISVGATMPSLNTTLMDNIPLFLPSLSIQKKVANVLSSLDSKIELNNRINAELEAMAKTLYDYWFVQFDFPDAKGKPYKTSGGKMVWNEELKRDVPEGWEVKRLSDIESNIVTGKTPPTNNVEFYNGDVPFITIGDIRGNMHVIETEIKLSLAGADYQKNKYIPKGSLCVTCIASPGLIGFTTQNSQTNQQINSVVLQKEENKTYLYYALNDYFKFSKGAKTGNTFSNMNKGDFEAIVLILPHKALLLNFEKIVNPIVEQILNLSKENQQLSELRDWLLPMLMNGQVTVKDMEDEKLSMAAEPELGYVSKKK